MKKHVLLLLTTVVLFSCKESLVYQFNDSPETIKCNGLAYDLAHEAYYSFRQDLAIYVKNQNIGYKTLNYKESLGIYIYRGAQGNYDFTEIATPHTLKILEKLKENKNLWNTTSKKSNLNYNSEFINCLIQGIKNEDVKETIIALRDTNSLNSDILAETYREHVFDCYTDNHFGMLLAFDTYYQHLYSIDFKN